MRQKHRKKNSVTILGEKCTLEFGYYPNNTIAITAKTLLGGNDWCVPTVNWERNFEGSDYAKTMCFPAVVIKNYSENHGVFEDLVNAGVIHEGFCLSGSAGKVRMGVLSTEWQAIAQKQFGSRKKGK